MNFEPYATNRDKPDFVISRGKQRVYVFETEYGSYLRTAYPSPPEPRFMVYAPRMRYVAYYSSMIAAQIEALRLVEIRWSEVLFNAFVLGGEKDERGQANS